jgi:hypothetical protein
MSISSPYPWEQDSYLTPVIEDDPLLQLDFYFESYVDKPTNMEEDESEYKVALTRALTDLESMRYGYGHVQVTRVVSTPATCFVVMD